MDLQKVIIAIKANLLSARLDNNLKTPKQVHKIVQKYQPTSGIDNTGWIDICNFILELEFVDTPPKAEKIAEKHNLTDNYCV